MFMHEEMTLFLNPEYFEEESTQLGGLMSFEPTTPLAIFTQAPLEEIATPVAPQSIWAAAEREALQGDSVISKLGKFGIPHESHLLADSIRQVVVGMRHLHSIGGVVLPSHIQDLLKTPAIVPECVWSLVGGGKDLAVLLGGHSLNGENLQRVDAKVNQSYKAGLVPTGSTKNLFTYEEILASLLKPSLNKDAKFTGRAPSNEGFNKREAKTYAKLANRCLRFAHCEGLSVVVPTEVFKAIELFRTRGKAEILCHFVEIATNWLMPASGLTYDLVRSAFQHLEAAVAANYRSDVGGSRPLTYVETEHGFDLVLGGGAKFVVTAPVGDFKAEVYVKASGSKALYSLRPFVATVPGIEGVVPESYIVKLESLDALWYAFEAYGFGWLNREHKGSFGLADMLGTYFTRFVTTQMPVQYFEYERDLNQRSNREVLTSNKYDTCAVAMPMPLLVVRKTLARHGHLTAAGSYFAANYASVTSYYNDLSARGSLKSHRVNMLGMIKACALTYSLTAMPIGAVKNFLADKLVLVRYNTDRLHGKRRIVGLLQSLWVSGGFKDTLGSFDPNDDCQIVEALWRKDSLAKAALAAGISRQAAQLEKADAFWALAIDSICVVVSSKQSKAVERVTTTYSSACRTNRDQVIGYRTAPTQINTAALVPTIVAPSMLSMPGMTLAQIGFLKAFFTKNEQVLKFILNADIVSAWIEVAAGLGATEIEVMDADGSSRLVGWTFPPKTTVNPDTVIGRLMVSTHAGTAIDIGYIYANTQGYIKEFTFEHKVDIGSERQLYAFAKVENQVVDTLKLRSPCGIKANVLAVKMWQYLGYKPDGKQSLNGKKTDKVEIFLYGDSYKGSDNFTAIVKLAGINYAYYAAQVPAMKALLISTNHKVDEYLGLEPQPDNSDWLYIQQDTIPFGVYAELVADFERRFSTNFWHYERTPVSGLPQIRMSQTRDRAVAAAYAGLQPNSAVKGDKWRFVSSAEAKIIVGVDGVHLPAELIFDVEIREHADDYHAPVVPIGTAYIVTDAPGQIGATHCVSCAWSSQDDTGRVEYHMLDRTYGWGPHAGLDLMFPVEVEEGTIVEALSVCKPMPFIATSQALDGNYDACEVHMASVLQNMEFDGLLRSCIGGVRLLSATQSSAEVDLTQDQNIAALFTPEELELLCQPEIYLNDLRFMDTLSKCAMQHTFRLPLSAKGARPSIVVHLGTLLKWNGGSLRHKGDTAVKTLTAWMKYWVVFGKDPYSEDMLMLADSIERMLNAYYQGKTHMKATLRGESSVYIKAAASSLIADDELWITAKTAAHFKSVYKLNDIAELTHVGFRRMPMLQSWIGKIRALSNADVSFYRKKYGVLFCANLAYMGAISMYVNFGDLDGDAIEVGNYSAEVAAGLPVTNFDSVAAMLAATLGYDFRNWEFWLNTETPDQYVTDHFQIPGWAKASKKAGISWEKNVMTIEEFADFQLAACSVQVITVGLTYRVAMLSLLLAEIVPQVNDRLLDLNGGSAPAWLNSMDWLLKRKDSALVIQRLLQLYEISLGGYDESMAKVTIGYLLRALNAQIDVDALTPSKIALGLATPEISDFKHVQPECDGYRAFSHLPTQQVQEAMQQLGFQFADLGKFRDCFLLMGVCAEYARNPLEADEISTELKLIFTVIQTVLDISQAKLTSTEALDSDENETNFRSLMNHQNLVYWLTVELSESEDEGEQLRLIGLLDLNKAILTETLTGRMFDAYLQNELLVNAEVEEGQIQSFTVEKFNY